MKITVMELGFKLETHREGLCYELFEWKPERTVTKGNYAGAVVAAGWKSTGRYPSTVAHGLQMMLELATNASGVSVKSIAEAVRIIQAASLAIVSAVQALSAEGGLAVAMK